MDKPQAEVDYEALLLLWMHDPVDKAWDIHGHVARAARYASTVLGSEVTREGLKFEADGMASAYERLPLMDGGAGGYKIQVQRGSLELRHPLSGKMRHLQLEESRPDLTEAYRRSVSGAVTNQQKFLALWSKLPGEAARVAPGIERIPADTRNPDHTIWQHLDTTAGIGLTKLPGGGGIALLRFQLGPVQKFISASRSIADLMTSSYLLCDLTFAGIEAVLERCGPTAIVSPSLRGLAHMNRWLRSKGIEVDEDKEALARASIPNLFLAIVPVNWADSLQEGILENVKRRWAEICESVRQRVDRELGKEFPGWDQNWQAQVENYFELNCVAFRLADFKPKTFGLELDDKGVKALQQLTKYQNSGEAGLWQAAVSYSALLMEAQRRIQHIPQYAVSGAIQEKCSLLGSYERLGPDTSAEQDRFWKAVHSLDGGEREDAGQESDRMSAIALVKRRALKDHYRPRYGITLPEALDTHAMAKRSKAPNPTAYYAMLMMDGDEMGKWLSGQKSPKLRDVLETGAREWFEKKGAGEALEERRPVSPALHETISAGLNRFSTRSVPEIIQNHNGVLIYSGGDDVLAALPLDRGLAAAMAIERAFREDDVMGETATISAGLVIAHSREDLRLVLEAARASEKRAKQEGRNRLALTVMRRNGEQATVVAPWSLAPRMDALRLKFLHTEATDRWSYRMRTQQAIWSVLPEGAFAQELRRQILKSEAKDQSFLEDWQEFRKVSPGPIGAAGLAFLQWIQSCSFLARTGDQRED